MKQKINKAFRKGETLLIYIVLDYNSFISSMDRPVHWAIVSMQISCFPFRFPFDPAGFDHAR